MLHTLNKAWVKILANQENRIFLFVANDETEKDYIYKILKEIDKTKGIKSDISITTYDGIKQLISFKKFYEEDFRMYDDILISHEIHDNILHDFLGRHCKRKCC